SDKAKLAKALGISKTVTEDITPSSSFLRSLFVDWQTYTAAKLQRPRFICIGSSVDDVVPPLSAHIQCDGASINYPLWGHTALFAPENRNDPRYATPIDILLNL